MTGEHAHGHGVIPYLRVRGAKAAVDFYVQAFGAVEFSRHPAEDGERLMHSHLGINGGSVMLSDEFPEHGGETGAPAGVTLHLTLDDPDLWWNRAVAAGAAVKMPLADQFWGDRYGILTDPFGHTWSLSSVPKTQD